MQIAHEGWLAFTKVMDWVADNWDQPDEGVWETRGGRKDFKYGRFQCWVDRRAITEPVFAAAS